MKSVARARELNRLLNECNFPSTTIHSAMRQEERLQVCIAVSSAIKSRCRLQHAQRGNSSRSEKQRGWRAGGAVFLFLPFATLPACLHPALQ